MASFENAATEKSDSNDEKSDPEMAVKAPRNAKLRAAFAMLDLTNTGTITVIEMGIWLSCEKSSVTYDALVAEVAKRGQIDGQLILFEHFEILCDHMEVKKIWAKEPIGQFATEEEYANDIASQAMSPLWMVMEMQNREAAAAGDKRKHAVGRIKLAKVLDSNWVRDHQALGNCFCPELCLAPAAGDTAVLWFVCATTT